MTFRERSYQLLASFRTGKENVVEAGKGLAPRDDTLSRAIDGLGVKVK